MNKERMGRKPEKDVSSVIADEREKHQTVTKIQPRKGCLKAGGLFSTTML